MFGIKKIDNLRYSVPIALFTAVELILWLTMIMAIIGYVLYMSCILS